MTLDFSTIAIPEDTKFTTNQYVGRDFFGTQSLFLMLDDKREVLFGGQAGGGKSEVLLRSAAQYCHIPGYSAIIFRRTYQQLDSEGKGLIPRSREIWSGFGNTRYNESRHTWYFDTGQYSQPATIQFGHMQYEKDKYNYQGPEWQFMGFDELTQFTETQYTYIFSRGRRLVDSPIPLRTRATTNPGGIGHEWVKARFIDPETKDPNAVFIPSSIRDNIYLNQDEYIAALGMLDPVTQAQLLHGDWDVHPEGNLLPINKFEIVDRAPPECRWVRFWDLAATEEREGIDPDYTAGCLMGYHEGIYYIGHMARWRLDPGETENGIKNIAAADGPLTAIRMEREGGASGKNTAFHYANLVLKDKNFRSVPATGSKVERARPLAAAVHNGLVRIVAGTWNRDFLDECGVFPGAGYHDDQVDATSGAFAYLRQIATREGRKSEMIQTITGPVDNTGQPQAAQVLGMDLRYGSRYRDADVDRERRRSKSVATKRRR